MSDAVVVGGGVIGLMCARELRRRGFQVTLVERDRPGR
jgi:glycine/D-amino acid oxidase-like deaminating enzyme